MKASARKLWRAAENLERRGWCRGTYKSVKGERCVVGAMRPVKNGTNWLPRTVPEQTMLCSLLGRTAEGWNDRACKDQIEAISLLQAAAICVQEGI